MQIENNYPKVKQEINKIILFRKITIIVFIISFLVCLLVNLIIGGKLWCLYVLGAEVLLYFSFLNKPLIENTFIKRFSVIVLIVCAYLYLIDLLEGLHFSYFVSTIICFSLLIVQALTFFGAYRYQKKNIMPIFYTCVASIVFILLALFGVLNLNWSIIVLGSLAFALLLLFFTLFKQTIIYELKKQFHTK